MSRLYRRRARTDTSKNSWSHDDFSAERVESCMIWRPPSRSGRARHSNIRSRVEKRIASKWRKDIFFAATQKRAKQKEREIAVVCQYLGRPRLPRSAGHLAWSGEASKKKSFLDHCPWFSMFGVLRDRHIYVFELKGNKLKDLTKRQPFKKICVTHGETGHPLWIIPILREVERERREAKQKRCNKKVGIAGAWNTFWRAFSWIWFSNDFSVLHKKFNQRVFIFCQNAPYVFLPLTVCLCPNMAQFNE